MRTEKTDKRNSRLRDLAQAIEYTSGMSQDGLHGAIRKVIKLLEFCPWLEDCLKEPLSNKKKTKRKRAK